MDIITDAIQRCYIEMDKFWVDEVQRATKALKDRNIDPEDIERWRNFRGRSQQTGRHGLFLLSIVSALTLKSTEKFHGQLECGCIATKYPAFREAFHFALAICLRI